MPRFTPITDVYGAGSTYDNTYHSFGVTIYKDYESQLSSTRYLSQHIQSLVEMCCGAHYYAQGPYTAAYSKASATINLSSISLDLKGRRTAIISLFVSSLWPCDMGIENSGSGWFSCFYSSHCSPTSGMNPVVSNATKVVISIEAKLLNGSDALAGTFNWYNGTTLIRSETLTAYAPYGTLYSYSNNIPIVRYGRFMSLLLNNGIDQIPTNDYADGSYMTGGNFSNLYLYSGSTQYTWDMSKLDYVWSVQGWNITPCSIGSTDSFGCQHSHYVYN